MTCNTCTQDQLQFKGRGSSLVPPVKTLYSLHRQTVFVHLVILYGPDLDERLAGGGVPDLFNNLFLSRARCLFRLLPFL